MELKSPTCNKFNSTIYFGGGTPTVYDPLDLQLLYNAAVNCFVGNNNVLESTIEANPDDLTYDYASALFSMGFNRLSIGLQSFIDRDLQMMHRRHNAAANSKAIAASKLAGFNNISIDLIYGIPNMTDEEWLYNINMALKMEVQHISAYYLTIEPRTLLGKQLEKGKFIPVDDETGAHHYSMLVNELQKAGFEQYEVSNFSLKGFRSKHNSAYWIRKPYVGIGPSAHGFDGQRTRTNNTSNNIRYIDSITNGIVPQSTETLTDTDIYNESLLTLLRTSYGLNISGIPATHINHFVAKAKKYLEKGILLETNGNYHIPSRYLLISDGVVTDLFM